MKVWRIGIYMTDEEAEEFRKKHPDATVAHIADIRNCLVCDVEYTTGADSMESFSVVCDGCMWNILRHVEYRAGRDYSTADITNFVIRHMETLKGAIGRHNTDMNIVLKDKCNHKNANSTTVHCERCNKLICKECVDEHKCEVKE